MGFFDTIAKAETLSQSVQTANPFANQDLGTVSEALGLLHKQNGRAGGDLEGRMPSVGIDAIIQDWVRQQFIYRRSILQDLYVMSYQVTEIRSVVLSIKRSVFKRGLGDWVPRWGRQCISCKKEFTDSKQLKCDECLSFFWNDNGEMEIIVDKDGKTVPSPTRYPRRQQKAYLEDLMSDCNVFHQSLLDVLQEFMEDILIADDGFLLLNKQYSVNRLTGEVTNAEIVEITRMHPALMEFDIDRKDGLPERSHFICVLHRSQIYTGPGHCNQNLDDGLMCGAKLIPAMYRYYMRGRYRYYAADEIIHKSYFSRSKTYGYSPVLTVFEKVLTLLGIDRWYYRYFYERRIPPGLVITYTDDPDSLETEIQRMKLQMREDPNTFPWIAAAARSQRGRTDFVKLGYTFEEMDSVSIRQEIRERVGMLWGVTPMHQGDSKSGGSSFSRENAQTQMYQELIESYQTIIDDVLEDVLSYVGITDYKRMLATPYGKTDQEALELDKLRTDIAAAMQALGYKPILDKETDTLEFEYEEMAPNDPLLQGLQGAGMMDGMGGGQMPGQPGMGNETGLPMPEPPPDAQEFSDQFEPGI